MLQRIQTIYLLIAFLCTILLLVFPIFSIMITDIGTESSELIMTAEFGAYGIVGGTGQGEFPVYFVIIALSLLSGMGILLYKKRPRQLLICRLNLIIHFLFTASVYLFYYFGEDFVTEALPPQWSASELSFGMETGFYLLIPPLALIWLAIRGIKRDENLVKSLDRLR
jgi:hypothetical protein